MKHVPGMSARLLPSKATIFKGPKYSLNTGKEIALLLKWTEDRFLLRRHFYSCSMDIIPGAGAASQSGLGLCNANGAITSSPNSPTP